MKYETLSHRQHRRHDPSYYGPRKEETVTDSQPVFPEIAQYFSSEIIDGPVRGVHETNAGRGARLVQGAKVTGPDDSVEERGSVGQSGKDALTAPCRAFLARQRYKIPEKREEIYIDRNNDIPEQ